jgi:hypothetical protein
MIGDNNSLNDLASGWATGDDQDDDQDQDDDDDQGEKK